MDFIVIELFVFQFKLHLPVAIDYIFK